MRFVFLNLLLVLLVLNTNLALSASYVKDEDIDYQLILDVESERQGEYVLRYYRTMGTLCMGYLDSIAFVKDDSGKSVSQTQWEIYKTKPLCELMGLDVGREFTDTHIEKIEFEENLVRLLISFTPLELVSEHRVECTVKVLEGVFGDLICSESVRLEY